MRVTEIIISPTDPLLVSGLIVWVVAVCAAHRINLAFRTMVQRLFQRGATSASVSDVGNEVERQVRKWRWLVVGIFVVAMFVAFAANTSVKYALECPLTYVEMALSAVAGYYVCRMIMYSRLSGMLNKFGTIRTEPAHPDGTAGLRPVGEFFLRQAVVAAAPAVYIGLWIILMTKFDYFDRLYTDVWLTSYMGLMVIAVAIEVFSFVLPMLAFHKEMRSAKEKALNEADGLGNKISKLRRQLSETLDPESRTRLGDELSSCVFLYDSIEGMATWPVGTRTRRLFTMNNVVLSLPLVVDMATGAEGWGKLFSKLGSLF